MVIPQTRAIFLIQISIPIQPILTAILNMAYVFDKSTRNPSRYARFGYDFPRMIKNKIDLLMEHGGEHIWVRELHENLLNSLESPTDLIKICQFY